MQQTVGEYFDVKYLQNNILLWEESIEKSSSESIIVVMSGNVNTRNFLKYVHSTDVTSYDLFISNYKWKKVEKDERYYLYKTIELF